MPEARPLWFRLARRGLLALDRALSVRPDALGPTRWVPEQHPSPRPSVAACDDRDMQRIDWIRDRPLPYSGVCRLQNAGIHMRAPGRLQHDRLLARRALIKVSATRHLPEPLGLRQFPELLRSRLSDAPRGVAKQLPGRTALLGNRVFDYQNYYHFWADCMGDVAFLRDVLPAESQPDRFLIAHADLPWQREILEMCGIAPDRVLRFSDHVRWQAEELLVPAREKGAWAMPPWLSDRLRALARFDQPDSPPFRKIYLSRADSGLRPVVNEPEVRRLLVAHGFEIRTAQGMSVAAQQRLFAEAACIVAPHGAGLTNLIWCPPGTRLLELLPGRHRVPCFLEIARQRRLQYQVLLCPQERSSKALVAPITVPLDQLEQRLIRGD